MKEGKKDEAETVKQQVADIKAKTKELEEVMKQAEDDKRDLLCTIPNVPYDLVPEGKSAEDNLIVKTGGHDIRFFLKMHFLTGNWPRSTTSSTSIWA